MSTKKVYRVSSSPSQGKKRRKTLKICGLDILLAIAFTVCVGYLFFILLPLNLVPSLWLTLTALILAIVLLLHLILSIVRQPMFAHWLRRVLITVIGGALIFASLTVQRVDNAVDDIIKLPTSQKELISIVTLRDPKLVDLMSLKGKTIATQSSIDTNHMAFAKKELKTLFGGSIANFNYPDYSSAVNALYNKKASAIIMSESYRTLIEETYEDFSEKTTVIGAYEIDVPIVEIVKPIDVTSNSFTVLVSGLDSLGKATLKGNSDVNMLVTINPLTKHIVINSIPRDAYLPNACLNNGYDKLTHTGALGLDCTIQTIENAFDVEVNYYARITFSSVIDIVNALDGIEVNVPMAFCEQRANRTGILYFKKGVQTLDGERALALARHRKTLIEGDIGRAKNQQLVINAIVKKAANPMILTKMDKIFEIIANTVLTNLSKKEIYAFANKFATDATAWTFSNHVVKGTNAWGECASMPGMELSVVKLEKEDVDSIKYMIKMASSDTDLSGFAFSLNDVEIKQVSMEGETEGAGGTNVCHMKP